MTQEIIIAGFGGQGVLSLGKILAYSGIMQGMEVTWMPSYGPEMRGGTANVTVILSDGPVSSPIVHEYDTVVVLNQQSLDKFESHVKSGGILIYDPNGITHPPKRTDISIFKVDAAQEAARMGNPRTFNMIVLGAMIEVSPNVTLENAYKGLEKSLPERLHKTLPANREAIQVGMKIVEKVQ